MLPRAMTCIVQKAWQTPRDSGWRYRNLDAVFIAFQRLGKTNHTGAHTLRLAPDVHMGHMLNSCFGPLLGPSVGDHVGMESEVGLVVFFCPVHAACASRTHCRPSGRLYFGVRDSAAVSFQAISVTLLLVLGCSGTSVPTTTQA